MKKLCDVKFDDVWCAIYLERTTQVGLRLAYSSVCATARNARIGLGDKAWNVIWLDELLDNPLVDDAVSKGERHDASWLGVVNVKVVIRAWRVGVLAERGVNAAETQQF